MCVVCVCVGGEVESDIGQLLVFISKIGFGSPCSSGWSVYAMKIFIIIWCACNLDFRGYFQFFRLLAKFVTYCHVTEWPQTGFRLLIGLIGYSDTAHDHILHLTITHALVSTVTSSLPLLGSGFQRPTFPFFCVPKLFPPSATSLYHQQLTATEPQQFCN
jgi:hypothetical protein